MVELHETFPASLFTQGYVVRFVGSIDNSTINVSPYQEHAINPADYVHNHVRDKSPQAPTERQWCFASATAIKKAHKDTVIEISSTHSMVNEAYPRMGTAMYELHRCRRKQKS